MQFESGYLYHIFNQGNNKQRVFFDRENYLFFLQKIRTHILPYADILAWCLMPNHFHLMVRVNFVNVKIYPPVTVGVAPSDADGNYKPVTVGVAPSDADGKLRSINDSIGIMLRSYTNAINKQNMRTGKLFREKTKAECINCPNGITPSFVTESGITSINVQNPEKEYPQVCFNYIHQNPVEAKLVAKAADWEFSSAADYAGLRGGKLVNKQVAGAYVAF